MKILSNNKKGFTLIELLAVIVILAILVMLAIPAVTRYLTAARKGAFADNAVRAIDAVSADVISKGFGKGANPYCNGNTCTYNKDAIDGVLDKKLTASPFGGGYKCAVIVVSQSGATTDAYQYTYTMTMIDENGNGFTGKTSDQINSDFVEVDGSLKDATCPTS